MAPSTEGRDAQKEDRAGGVQTAASIWTAEGDTSAFKKALNPTFDPYRFVAMHRMSLIRLQPFYDFSRTLDVINYLFSGIHMTSCELLV